MDNFLERLIVEKKELSEKISKLERFLDTETFKGLHEIDQQLLKQQLVAMSDYNDVLEERIERASPSQSN